MGVNRLAIIDIEGGSQPMQSDDRTVTVVMNGEIYNYIELRDELSKDGISFKTNSDTEELNHVIFGMWLSSQSLLENIATIRKILIKYLFY